MVFHLNEIMISDENLQIRLFDLMTTYSTMVNDQFCFNFLLSWRQQRTCTTSMLFVTPLQQFRSPFCQQILVKKKVHSTTQQQQYHLSSLPNHYIYYIHSSSRGNWEFTGACPIFSVRERAVLCEWSLARNDNVQLLCVFFFLSQCILHARKLNQVPSSLHPQGNEK